MLYEQLVMIQREDKNDGTKKREIIGSDTSILCVCLIEQKTPPSSEKIHDGSKGSFSDREEG